MRERAALVLEEAKRSVNIAAIMTIIFFLEVNSVSYRTVKKKKRAHSEQTLEAR